MISIGRAVLPVADLDAALDWYATTLGFRVQFDQEIFPGFRAVHVGPSSTVTDPGVWLFPTPDGPRGTNPSLVLHSDDISALADHLAAARADVLVNLAGPVGDRSLQVRDPWGNVIVIADAPGGHRHVHGGAAE